MLPDDPRHGENRGYLAHRRAGQHACPDCRRAHVRYEKRRKHDRHNGRARLIDPTGSQRRIQALVALGWTYGRIGQRLGISAGGVYKMIVRYGVIRRDIADQVAAVYDELSMKLPPTGTRWEKRDASYARTTARKHGWVPPLCWNDHEIDDPAAEPHGVRSGAASGVDPVVVARILGGEWRMPCAPAEKTAVCAAWVGRGGTLGQLERMTGWRVSRYYRKGDAA